MNYVVGKLEFFLFFFNSVGQYVKLITRLCNNSLPAETTAGSIWCGLGFMLHKKSTKIKQS